MSKLFRRQMVVINIVNMHQHETMTEMKSGRFDHSTKLPKLKILFSKEPLYKYRNLVFETFKEIYQNTVD